MDPRDFLLVADNLARSTIEAERRTSASRSYYALYNCLYETLSGKGISYSGSGTDHVNLRKDLVSCNELLASQLGGSLGLLWEKRRDADYNMNGLFSDRDSCLALKQAQKWIDRFKSMHDEDLSDMVKKIKAGRLLRDDPPAP